MTFAEKTRLAMFLQMSLADPKLVKRFTKIAGTYGFETIVKFSNSLQKEIVDAIDIE